MQRTFRHILAGTLVLSLSVWAGTVAIRASAAQPSGQATGAMQGQLKDPFGQVATGLNIPIAVTDVASGKVYSGQVEITGRYTIEHLPAGTYDLNLPIPGALYRTYQQKGIAISAGQTVKLDLPLTWGNGYGEIGNDPGILSDDLRRRSKYVDGPTPRTAAGHPDFAGEWAPIPQCAASAVQGARTTFASCYVVPERKTNGETRGPGENRGPGGNGPPMKPWAKAIDEKLQAAGLPQKDGGPGNGGPAADCLTHSATPERTGHEWEFIQTPTRLIQYITQEEPVAREIYLDGRKHPNPDLWNPAWYGHSVGHWEGDTLVVDTVGFNDITPGYGVHTEALHVVERITRPRVGRLVIDITATDPKAWTGPYHTLVEDGLVTGDEVLEWMCFNNDVHFGGDWLTLAHQLMATAPPEALADPVSPGGKP